MFSLWKEFGNSVRRKPPQPENTTRNPSDLFKKFLNTCSNILINFSDFLAFLCYKETNEVSIQQMSAFVFSQPTLNRLFNNSVKLY